MIKTYKTIVADPPWPYKSNDLKASPKARPKTWNGVTGGVSSSVRYGSMTMNELKGMKIPAANDSHLYLWTTNSFLVEAHELAKAWGFKPKTLLTWVKTKKDSTPSMKMGYYYRGATEHILFCVRGKLKLIGPPRPTAYLAPREEHSTKPQLFYDLAMEQSPGPYLELFARKKKEGWDAWGNQVESDIVLV